MKHKPSFFDVPSEYIKDSNTAKRNAAAIPQNENSSVVENTISTALFVAAVKASAAANAEMFIR